MRLVVAWWDLVGDDPGSDDLRADLASAGEWADVEGLVAKLWISDRATGRWGAVMVWQADVPDQAELPPNRAAELVGRPPCRRAEFEVEAVVCGRPGVSPLVAASKRGVPAVGHHPEH